MAKRDFSDATQLDRLKRAGSKFLRDLHLLERPPASFDLLEGVGVVMPRPETASGSGSPAAECAE